MKHIDIKAFEQVLHDKTNDTSVDFINVCTTPEYNEKHIPGVRSVPLDTIEERVSEFDNKKTVYVHCRSGRRAEQAIEKLTKLGVTAELVNVTGGILAWDEANLPTSRATTRMPLMQQVLLSAGSLVTLGVLLALLLNPLFIFLSLFVGLGLMFAGITGWCGMSYLLAKMPWNK